LEVRLKHFYNVIDEGPNPDVGFKSAMALKIEPPNHLNQNALDFELALKGLLAAQMQKGLTVTEAVGTLHLCADDITNQFFNSQPVSTSGHN